jgi:hypothetical protein
MATNFTDIIITDGGSVAPSARSFVSMINNISMRIRGTLPSDATGVNPSKATIGQAVNDSYLSIVRKRKDWLWLNSTITVEGYNITAEDETEIPVTVHTNPQVLTPATVTGTTTEQIAQKFSVPVDEIWEPSAIAIYLSKVGIGYTNGILQLKIVPILASGEPDTANPICYSNAITVINDALSNGQILTSTLQEVSFTMALGTQRLLPDTSYFALLVLTNAVDSGARIYLGSNTAAITDLTATRVSNWQSSYAWTYPNNAVYVKVTYDLGQIETTMTLPATVDKLNLLTGSVNGTSVNLTESYDNKDGSGIASGTFAVVKTNADGSKTIRFNAASNKVVLWSADVKLIATPLINDYDEPLLPLRYRDLIEFDAELLLRARGVGINTPQYLELLQGKITEGYMRLLQDETPEVSDMVPQTRGFTPYSSTYGQTRYNGYNNRGRYPTKP